jgi:hypothetical protein
MELDIIINRSLPFVAAGLCGYIIMKAFTLNVNQTDAATSRPFIGYADDDINVTSQPRNTVYTGRPVYQSTTSDRTKIYADNGTYYYDN